MLRYRIRRRPLTIVAVTYVGMNLVTDSVYGSLDPHIRYE